MSGKKNHTPTFKGVQVQVTSELIFIDATLFNNKVVIDLSLMGLAIYLTFRIENTAFYTIPLIAMHVGILYMLWFDFKPINKIIIDRKERLLYLQSKNLLQRLFFKKKKYYWDDIDILSIRSNESSEPGLMRNYIDMHLKRSSSVVLLSFIDQNEAESMVNFLKTILKS